MVINNVIGIRYMEFQFVVTLKDYEGKDDVDIYIPRARTITITDHDAIVVE